MCEKVQDLAPREILRWLGVPGPGATRRDRAVGSNAENSFDLPPCRPFRPLRTFSDYVCEQLGADNQRIYEGSLSGPELFTIVEDTFDMVSAKTEESLLTRVGRVERRVALLDLVWVLRSLDIAHTGDPTYPARKRASRLFGMAHALAGIERRHPVLAWSDIAIYHPISDPRTFLPRGKARDEEILMYSVQNALERLFKGVHERDWTRPTRHMLIELQLDLKDSLRAIMHYGRVRTVGQFYQLDPYLGANNEYRGHATGAFSAWTLLMGVFLSGNESFARRLRDPANRKAFDRDADPYIDQIVAGTFSPLGARLAAAPLEPKDRTELEAMHDEARHIFTLFLHSHRGAIKRHAPASFADPSPTDPTQTNIHTISEAIDDMAADRTRLTVIRP